MYCAALHIKSVLFHLQIKKIWLAIFDAIKVKHLILLTFFSSANFSKTYNSRLNAISFSNGINYSQVGFMILTDLSNLWEHPFSLRALSIMSEGLSCLRACLFPPDLRLAVEDYSFSNPVRQPGQLYISPRTIFPGCSKTVRPLSIIQYQLFKALTSSVYNLQLPTAK